jgi:hypothetical protein
MYNSDFFRFFSRFLLPEIGQAHQGLHIRKTKIVFDNCLRLFSLGVGEIDNFLEKFKNCPSPVLMTFSKNVYFNGSKKNPSVFNKKIVKVRLNPMHTIFKKY